MAWKKRVGSRWSLLSYPSADRSGAWVVLIRKSALHRGPGQMGFCALLGADADIPLRPWPQVWVERRPNGQVLACVIVAGVGAGVLVSSAPGRGHSAQEQRDPHAAGQAPSCGEAEE